MSESPASPEITLSLRERLNTETARIAWKELQTFFARGAVVAVEPEVDLVEVAARMVEDDKSALEAWLLAGQVALVTPERARAWYERDAQLWAVVAAPWVVVQDRAG